MEVFYIRILLARVRFFGKSKIVFLNPKTDFKFFYSQTGDPTSLAYTRLKLKFWDIYNSRLKSQDFNRDESRAPAARKIAKWSLVLKWKTQKPRNWFFMVIRLVVLLVGAYARRRSCWGVAQDGSHTAANRMTDMHPLMLDINVMVNWHLSKQGIYRLTSIALQMFFIAFVLCILGSLKLKPEGQTIYRKPHCKVTKLKWKFSLILG